MPPRRTPEHRFGDLLKAATAVFIRQGYRLTQMSDIAHTMGVAKGTVYLYVKSKEALFAAALTYADTSPPGVSELELPIPAPEPGQLLCLLEETLARETVPPALAGALDRRRVGDIRTELEAIVRELYALSSRHRTAIKLLDRCGRDHPELSSLYYERGRFTQVDLLARYIDSRVERGRFRAVSDSRAAARFVVELVATWAVHIYWDPAPQPIDPVVAEETLVQFVLGGLLAE